MRCRGASRSCAVTSLSRAHAHSLSLSDIRLSLSLSLFLSRALSLALSCSLSSGLGIAYKTHSNHRLMEHNLLVTSSGEDVNLSKMAPLPSGPFVCPSGRTAMKERLNTSRASLILPEYTRVSARATRTRTHKVLLSDRSDVVNHLCRICTGEGGGLEKSVSRHRQ